MTEFLGKDTTTTIITTAIPFEASDGSIRKKCGEKTQNVAEHPSSPYSPGYHHHRSGIMSGTN